MTKHNIRELDLDLLDVAVAKECIAAGDLDIKVTDAGNPATIFDADRNAWVHFRPSVNWAHAGPVIEGNWSCIAAKMREWLGERWGESSDLGGGRQLLCWLLRASVATHRGDEIDL